MPEDDSQTADPVAMKRRVGELRKELGRPLLEEAVQKLADRAMGLQERAPASPRVQEICALMVLESPAGQAEANVRRLTGLDLGPASMHREARRQGDQAYRSVLEPGWR